MSWILWGQIATLMVIAYVLVCSGLRYFLINRKKVETGELR